MSRETGEKASRASACLQWRPRASCRASGLEAWMRLRHASLAGSAGLGGCEHSSISLVCSQEDRDETVL